MQSEDGRIWECEEARFLLSPLDHGDLAALFRGGMLPSGDSMIDEVDQLGAPDGEGRAYNALVKMYDALQAILAASLRKGQPWMTQEQAASLIGHYCGEEHDYSTPDRLLIESIAVGAMTLNGLQSQHRERLEELIAMTRNALAISGNRDDDLDVAGA